MNNLLGFYVYCHTSPGELSPQSDWCMEMSARTGSCLLQEVEDLDRQLRLMSDTQSALATANGMRQLTITDRGRASNKISAQSMAKKVRQSRLGHVMPLCSQRQYQLMTSLHTVNNLMALLFTGPRHDHAVQYGSNPQSPTSLQPDALSETSETQLTMCVCGRLGWGQQLRLCSYSLPSLVKIWRRPPYRTLLVTQRSLLRSSLLSLFLR